MRRDIESYRRVIDSLLAQRVGMRRYFTYIVTKDMKAMPAPFEMLAEPAPEA